ncbi:MAG: arginine decarboxylase, partial [Tolypothrix sp. Co-bin9]|nr:arginine decarboxylase [Tolypothrix sp. Co-bin9]
ISKALQLVQSTSPSYLLLASLDAARQQMALHGKMLMSRTLQLADEARTKISQIPGLSVLQIPSKPYQGGLGGSSSRGGLRGSPGFVALDETRLTVTVSGLGLTGFEADEILDEKFAVTAEFASLQHLTFIISLGNTPADIEQLVQSFTTLAKEYRKTNLTVTNPNWQNILSTQVHALHFSPREAFFAVSETLPLAQTSDRICAEIVCPYPPGIPVLMPGEIITKPILDYLQQIQAMGGFISGCGDISLRTLKVVN